MECGQSTKRKTGGQQASSHAVACPSTAPEVWREHDAPPEEGRWLEREQQEWARLRAGGGQHLVDGEQPSQACSTAKKSAEEQLAVIWHLLPTPYLLELADMP